MTILRTALKDAGSAYAKPNTGGGRRMIPGTIYYGKVRYNVKYEVEHFKRFLFMKELYNI